MWPDVYIVASEILSHKLVRRLRVVRTKGPKSGEPIVGFHLHDNAPAHQSDLVKDFLAKNNVTTLEHLPPYSPHLPPTDFYLFPRRKSALKGRLFCDATRIAFTKWLPGMILTVVGRSVYLYKGSIWRTFSLNDCTVLYFSEIKLFPQHFEATSRVS